MNECLLNEIERKEKIIEKFESTSPRFSTDKDTIRMPSRTEGSSLDKTIMLLRDTIKQKEETIIKLKSQIDRTDLPIKQLKSLPVEQTFLQAPGTFVKHKTHANNSTPTFSRSNFRDVETINFFRLSKRKKKRELKDFVIINISQTKDNKIFMRNRSDENTVDPRFTFGKPMSSSPSTRVLEFENQILRSISKQFNIADSFMRKINQLYFLTAIYLILIFLIGILIINFKNE